VRVSLFTASFNDTLFPETGIAGVHGPRRLEIVLVGA
jgi:hypothetical protein